MITSETARRIWSSHKEIEHSKELLAAAHERLKQETEGSSSRDEPEKKFHPIEMGIPYFNRDRSDTSHRVYQLTTDLAVMVLEAHVEKQKERLRKLMVMAQQELDGVVQADPTL